VLLKHLPLATEGGSKQSGYFPLIGRDLLLPRWNYHGGIMSGKAQRECSGGLLCGYASVIDDSEFICPRRVRIFAELNRGDLTPKRLDRTSARHGPTEPGQTLWPDRTGCRRRCNDRAAAATSNNPEAA
jgi:hypothetical protein